MPCTEFGFAWKLPWKLTVTLGVFWCFYGEPTSAQMSYIRWINFYVERVAMLAFNEAWKRRIPESGGFRRAWHWKTSNFALGVARRIKTKTKVSTCDGETQFDLFRNWNGIFTCVGLHQSTKQFLRLGRKKEKTTEWHRSLTLCRSDAFRRKMSQSSDSKQLLLVAEKWPAGRSLPRDTGAICLRRKLLFITSLEKRPV